MKVLNDEDIDFGIGRIGINIIVWLFIWIGCFIFKKYKEEISNKISVFIAFLISAMQLVVLVSLLFPADILEQKKDGYLTTENMLSLSAENLNVVVFILDTFDARFMETILDEEPTYLDKFTEFTYFPNALGTHSRTFPSITYLLIGEKCYFEKNPYVYLDEAFLDSDFLPSLTTNNVDVGI